MLMREDVLLGKIAEVKKDLIELEQQLLAQRHVIAIQANHNKQLVEENEALKTRITAMNKVQVNERIMKQLTGINQRRSPLE